jgi:phage tail-like protein
MPSLGLNAAFGLAANILGVRADPYRAFNFLVEIEGIIAGGFTECSGLSVETEFFDYREGGCNEYVHRFAGPTRYPPLVLKHGLSPLDGLWAWHQDVVQETITRRNGTIYLLDAKGLPALWWDFKDAFPVKWSGPDLRAESSSVAVESVELAHRGLSRPRLATALAGLGAQLAGSLDIGASVF